jgi:hypothetical protein
LSDSISEPSKFVTAVCTKPMSFPPLFPGSSPTWMSLASGPLTSFEWIADLKEIEFLEIHVRGVNHPDIVLAQKGGQMGIGDEIPANREPSGGFPVDFQEAFHLSQNLHPG